ncbi:major facilitator superfamily MFS_1 [Richelia sinica FACHB-800]|uniref:Major facilitator superfamily MFS_1 n=1 Tax=Richelia sinica FACHB-800 TaxID=1357546 RepID=A0A975TA77_9NOST|nr:MFS transporter [Richelia sinica]MBD2666541.1 MFS transporter [Richelia sinica FACHB-800]QXE24221.1 major facilitator superfamily MFS_1 [Richelia sinica FACHB-800]
MSTDPSSPSPWRFIPTLYFGEGVPNVIISTVAVVLYKKLGIDNNQITAWTSFLYLPWVLKMFWGPLVDIYATKRTWILTTQFAMCCCLSLVALSLQLPNFFFISLAAFTLGAFVSATYDIATDGFYMLALNSEQQAFFVGIRSLFYRLAMLFGSGFLLVLAGYLENKLNYHTALSWSMTIGFAALIFAILFIYHRFTLPFPESQKTNKLPPAATSIPFWQIIKTYFQQGKIGAILAFILLYRFGEAMLLKVAALFLVDEVAQGGLGLSTDEFGLVYGTYGVLSLIIGGILGGVLIARYGLRKCLLPMALALNLPNIFYVYLAYYKPGLLLIYPLVSLEQFGYGLGFTAFSVYLMYICQGEYKTSHYAISTGLMALGLMLPGAISGTIQKSLGYPLFFVLVCLLTIPGIITIFFIPLAEEKLDK